MLLFKKINQQEKSGNMNISNTFPDLETYQTKFNTLPYKETFQSHTNHKGSATYNTLVASDGIFLSMSTDLSGWGLECRQKEVVFFFVRFFFLCVFLLPTTEIRVNASKHLCAWWHAWQAVSKINWADLAKWCHSAAWDKCIAPRGQKRCRPTSCRQACQHCLKKAPVKSTARLYFISLDCTCTPKCLWRRARWLN